MIEYYTRIPGSGAAEMAHFGLGVLADIAKDPSSVPGSHCL